MSSSKIQGKRRSTEGEATDSGDEAIKPLQDRMKDYVTTLTKFWGLSHEPSSIISKETGAINPSLDTEYDQLEGLEVLFKAMASVTREMMKLVYAEKMKRLEEGGEEGPEKMNELWLERMFGRLTEDDE